MTKKRLKIKISGSYTVEAAFIVPIILGILFSMIYILYIYHDKVILYSNMEKTMISVVNGERQISNDEEWQKELSQNLWFFKIKSGSISEHAVIVKANVSAEQNLSIPVMEYFMAGRQKIELSSDYIKTNPSMALRIKDMLNIRGGGK